MRVLCVAALFLVVCLVLSSAINPKRRLINRPTKDLIFRGIRSVPVKGAPSPLRHVYDVKGVRPIVPLMPVKGEYLCGENNDRICKLRPGEIPKGCEEHTCQYPIA